ncbi:MAG: hypothetical protein H6834_08575 [Planctomycetes bacterium]|nr:hypothetical protein [Planctomycetota bacterium]
MNSPKTRPHGEDVSTDILGPCFVARPYGAVQFWLWLLSIALALAFLTFALLVIASTVIFSSPLALPAAVLAMASLIGAIWSHRARKRWGGEIEYCTRGIAVHHRGYREYLYAEIESYEYAGEDILIQFIIRIRHERVIVRFRCGKAFRLVDRDGRGFTHRVMEACDEVLFPQALRSIEDGAPVMFGKLRIERDGFAVNKKSYSWSNFQRVEIADGILRLHVIERKRPVLKKRVCELPSFQVAVRLLNWLGARRYRPKARRKQEEPRTNTTPESQVLTEDELAERYGPPSSP